MVHRLAILDSSNNICVTHIIVVIVIVFVVIIVIVIVIKTHVVAIILHDILFLISLIVQPHRLIEQMFRLALFVCSIDSR